MTGRRKLATIMAVDVAGYSRAAEADEGAAAEAVARLRATIEEIIAPFGGRVFNTAGDGVMIEFPAATSGAQAAVKLLAESRAGVRPLPQIRIGLHLGEVIVADDGDLLGHGVNVAARLQALAEPGAAVVSQAVQSQLRSAADIPLVSQGKVQLDKMSERMEVYSLTPGRRIGFLRILHRQARPTFVAGLALVGLAAAAYGAWRAIAPPPAEAPQALLLASDQFAFNVINAGRVCEYAMFARDFPESRLVSMARSRAGATPPCDEALIAADATARTDGRSSPPFKDLRVNERAIALIKQYEGLRRQAVQDPVGLWTIGYSHMGEDVRPGMTITEAEADQLLRKDLAFFESIIKSMVTAPMNADEYSAIVDLAFNIGTGAFSSSAVLRALNEGDRAVAADAFLGWDEVNGVEVPALARRRAIERTIFLSQPSP
jgi:lysozyme